MMRVYLDDRLLEGAGSTLGAALATARAGASGRLIVDVLADGRPVPPEHLEAPPPTSPYAGELRLATADPRGLASRALRDASGELTRSAPAYARAGELVQAGKMQQALETLKDSLPAWEIVQQTASACLSIDGLLGEERRRRVETSLEALAKHLRQIKESLNAGDWSTLADALLYDSGALIGNWTALLDTLATDLERA
jgi:hypothetical protein